MLAVLLAEDDRSAIIDMEREASMNTSVASWTDKRLNPYAYFCRGEASMRNIL